MILLYKQPLKDYCYGFVLMCDGEGAQNAVKELKQNGPLCSTWTVAFSKDKNDDSLGVGHLKSEKRKDDKLRKKDKSKEKFKKDKNKPKKKKSESSSSSDSSKARSDMIEQKSEFNYKKQKKQKKKKLSSSSESSSSKLPTRSALVRIENKPNDSNLFDMVFSGEPQPHPLYQQTQQQSQYQIKHIVHVRELFISGIPQSKTQSDIQRIFSHYGIVERIDIIPKQLVNFAYVKFKKLDAVNYAIQNTQYIADQLESAGQVKIYSSDPFKRAQIVGNAEDSEKDEDMLPVMFIGFPPNQNFTIDEKFLKKMAEKYGGDVKGVQFFQPQSPQLRSYVLIEFSQLRDCKKARRKFCRYKIQILGDKKCDVAILSNYSNNPQNKKQATQYIPYGMDYMAANPQMSLHPQMMPRPFQPQMTMMQPYQTQPLSQQQQLQPSLFGDFNQMPIIYPQQQQNQQQMMYVKTQSHLSLPTQSAIQQQFRPPQQQQPINPYYQQINSQTSNQNYTQQQFMDMIMPPSQIMKNDYSNTTFWSGYMNRGKQHRVGIDARLYSTAIDAKRINLPCNLEMSYICSYQDAYQKSIQDQSAVLIFSPAQESDIPKFAEYVQYLRSKQRAGVIQTETLSIYVIPPGVESKILCIHFTRSTTNMQYQLIGNDSHLLLQGFKAMRNQTQNIQSINTINFLLLQILLQFNLNPSQLQQKIKRQISWSANKINVNILILSLITISSFANFAESICPKMEMWLQNQLNSHFLAISIPSKTQKVNGIDRFLLPNCHQITRNNAYHQSIIQSKHQYKSLFFLHCFSYKQDLGQKLIFKSNLYDNLEEKSKQLQKIFKITNYNHGFSLIKITYCMMEWSEKLGLSINSLFLAIQFLDYFVQITKESQSISQKKVDPIQFRLYGATCLMLAAKSIELDERIPFISKLRRYTYLPYATIDFRKCECQIIKQFNWNLQYTTLIDWAETVMSLGIVYEQDELSQTDAILKEKATNIPQSQQNQQPKQENNKEQVESIQKMSTSISKNIYNKVQEQFTKLCLTLLKDGSYLDKDPSELTLSIIGCVRKTCGLKHPLPKCLLELYENIQPKFQDSIADLLSKQTKQPTSVIGKAFTNDLDFFSLQNYKNRIL